MIARKGFPAEDLKGLVAYMKANPGKATFVDQNAAARLTGILMQQATGTTVQFIPYRGAGPAMQDLIGERLDFIAEQISTAIPQIQGKTVKALVTLGLDRAPGLEPMADVLSVPPPALIRRLARSGIVGLGGAAFPAATKLAEAAERGASHLVLNGAECEPWICCDDALMRERAIDVVQGARVLAHAIGAKSITVAIEDDKPEAIAAMRTAAASDGPTVDVLVLDSRYPAGAERTLATAVTGREVPSGGLPTEIGVLCQNVGTAAAVARFVATGEPLLRRIVTVTGSGIANPANVDASIGTPIAALVAACDGYAQAPVRLIAGGAMTGRALPTDAVSLVKGLNCVIAASASDLAAPASERPCIRCGECAVVCPAILLPQQIHRAVLLGDLGRAAGFGLEDCIECGACDYVCPSRIPLTDRFRAARVTMHEHAASNVREFELSQARAGERRT
jgi:electron transport complex protein RnfC